MIFLNDSTVWAAEEYKSGLLADWFNVITDAAGLEVTRVVEGRTLWLMSNSLELFPINS